MCSTITNEAILQRADTRPLATLLPSSDFGLRGTFSITSNSSTNVHDLVSCFFWEAWKQGQPKITWCWTFTGDLKSIDVSWDETEIVATDDPRWRLFAAQCATRRRKN